MEIFNWKNITYYFFGAADFSENKICIYEDFSHFNFLVDADAIGYCDKFENIKISFENLKTGYLHKKVIISSSDVNNEEMYHFSVYVDKNTRLEFLSSKETELIGVFMQDKDEYLAIYYIDGHLQIINNNVYYCNSDANEQYISKYPYYTLDSIEDIINISFQIALYLMKNQIH